MLVPIGLVAAGLVVVVAMAAVTAAVVVMAMVSVGMIGAVVHGGPTLSRQYHRMRSCEGIASRGRLQVWL